VVAYQSLRSWSNCAYFARNDFYESKILKILTLPCSRLIPISFSYRLASWYVLAYFVPNVLCNSKNC